MFRIVAARSIRRDAERCTLMTRYLDTYDEPYNLPVVSSVIPSIGVPYGILNEHDET